jgi:hypothetical protein
LIIEEGLQLIARYEKLLFQATYEKWIKYNVFTIRWWILLGILFIPWLIWYLLVDKKRLQEMFLYVFTTIFIAVLLDEIGTSLSLWSYPVNILPFLPHLIDVNYTLVPIIFTIVYQYIPKWKLFILANIIIAVVFSFILEPILVWAKFYTLITWKYIYSVPVYFFAAIILKSFISMIKSLEDKHSNRNVS